MQQMLKDREGAGTRVRYRVIEETLHSPELGQYRTFGVQILKETKSGWKTEKTISDVSVDREMVTAFVQSCNEQQLDPVHLEDAVENLINS